MVNNLSPKLGRPLTGGSTRDEYLKFYLSLEEMNLFHDREKSLKSLLEEKGFHYNRPAFFRLFLSNFDNPHVLHFLLDNLTPEFEKSKL